MTETQLCPECRGDSNWPAPMCHTCDGSGEVPVAVMTCGWCEMPATDLVLVEDWTGEVDQICPTCVARMLADPDAHGGGRVVEAVQA